MISRRNTAQRLLVWVVCQWVDPSNVFVLQKIYCLMTIEFYDIFRLFGSRDDSHHWDGWAVGSSRTTNHLHFVSGVWRYAPKLTDSTSARLRWLSRGRTASALTLFSPCCAPKHLGCCVLPCRDGSTYYLLFNLSGSMLSCWVGQIWRSIEITWLHMICGRWPTGPGIAWQRDIVYTNRLCQNKNYSEHEYEPPGYAC